MNKVILGGAPDANWFPLLILFVAVVSVLFGCHYVFKMIIRKKYRQMSDNNNDNE
jgi:Flp pilus assembly protein TadB